MKKILGMGNALTDMLLCLDDEGLLGKLKLLKGGMHLIDDEKLSRIYEVLNVAEAKMAAGGSASNTVNGIACLGGKAGFWGKVGRDEIGDFFMKDTLHHGVVPHLSYGNRHSGTCTVLVSGDGERTMCTFLGASGELGVADINPEILNGYDILHVEGYLVQNHELIYAAVKMAKEAGLLVSVDLASYNVVEANSDFLKSIVAEFVDIVFANEDEARAFTGKDPEEALGRISEYARIAVVKTGKTGSWVQSEGVRYRIKPYRAECIDTTGAGDLYAAGFLYGMACGYPLEKCGEIGSLVSSRVVQVLGAKMSPSTWEEINRQVKRIVMDTES